MNFLAHLYLSGSNDKIIVGNFLGDFVKGRKYVNYDPLIIRGIKLHRSIDSFTDQNPIISRSKKRLDPKYGHYAGVIIDIFYDHFLATDWKRYSNQNLDDFARYSYNILTNNMDLMPQKASMVIPVMKNSNWLCNYQYVEGIARTLSGMDKRTIYVSRMEEAVHDLERNYTDFQQDFHDFFPILQKHCVKFINNND